MSGSPNGGQTPTVEQHMDECEQNIDHSVRKIAWKPVFSSTGFLLIGNSVRHCVLIEGLLAATGHHGFYKYLDQKPSNTLPQTIVSGISTACILVVKTAATSLILTSYCQQLWAIFSRKDFKAEYIDILMAGPFTWSYYFKPKMWSRAPVAWLMALSCWIIPIAVLFPPGALEVRTVLQRTNSTLTVPALYSSREDAVGSLLQTNTNGVEQGVYAGPSYVLSVSVWQSIVGHMIVPFVAPCSGGNCTYTQNIIGPVFTCLNTTDDFRQTQIPHQLGPYMVQTDLSSINDTFYVWFQRSNTALTVAAFLFSMPYAHVYRV